MIGTAGGKLSKNDNVMIAIEMSYLTSGQQSVYNAFLLD
jgi:hypothetical protein